MPRLLPSLCLCGLFAFGCSSNPSALPDVMDSQDVGAFDAPTTDIADASDLGDAGADIPATSPTTDLIPWSRLTAPLVRTGAHVDDLRDGPGAIRDGDAETGWLVPPLGGRLVADWQPWLGDVAVIASVSVELESERTITLRLLDGCGGATLWEAEGTGKHIEFDVPRVEAACFEAALDDGRILGIQVHAVGALDTPRAPITERDPIEIEYPKFGVFEGHSGPVWSWDERDALLRAHALHGLGTYVYAPGGDALRGGQWRLPYPDSWIDNFGRLVELSHSLEFSIIYGISPFSEWSTGDEDRLLEKLGTIAALGVDSFVIMADGLPPDAINTRAAEAHVAATAVVRAWMDAEGMDAELYFLPAATTEAQRNRAADGPGYYEALTNLPDGVTVGWSGAESWNAETSPMELEALGETVGHAPLFLDTCWSGPSVRLGTYTGRDGLQATPPVWIRAGDRPGIARFNLHQFAHWTQQRSGGPTGARDFAAVVEDRWALRETESSLDSELLNEIARAFDGAGPTEPTFQDYELAIDTVSAELESGSVSDRALRNALTMFTKMAALRSLVWHSSLAIDLVDDLWLRLDFLRVEGQRSLWAMLALRELLGGRAPDDAMAELELLEASLGGLPADTSPDAFDRLWSAIEGTESAADGPDTLLFYEPPDRCIAQSSLGWRPFPDATWVTISGLPGATVDDDFVQWFSANAGTYHAVIAATAGTPTTWNFRLVDIVCGPG